MLTNLIKPEIQLWLNKSGQSELYASNLYRYMANQMQRLGLFGAQKFFLKESASELEHYQKLANYTNDMGSVLEVPAIEEIKEDVTGILTALQISYETELELLNQYREFYEKAEDEMNDCITATFLIWFLQKQVESVGEFGDLIARYNRGGDVFEFDEYLSEL